jgi:predicted nuclease of predicted toxin-antitoxin system
VKILLDHNVPRRYVRLLEAWGHSAIAMTDYIAESSSDVCVIALAQELDAVLMTFDLDFANILDYPPVDYGGILGLRFASVDDDGLDQMLRLALSELERDDIRSALVVVTPNHYRVRR